MKRWLDENKNKLLTLSQLCIFAARSDKKVNWTEKTTLNPKPEDLSVPPALWRLLDDNIKCTIIVLQKMYRDDKQQNTNEGTAKAIDTKKKHYDGNLQTSFSSKKKDKEPTQILQCKAQQATSVPPVTKNRLRMHPMSVTTSTLMPMTMIQTFTHLWQTVLKKSEMSQQA